MSRYIKKYKKQLFHELEEDQDATFTFDELQKLNFNTEFNSRSKFKKHRRIPD